MSSGEEVAAHIERVDKVLNGRGKVADEDKAINIQALYARYGWGDAATSLPGDALSKLRLEDKTPDPRWAKHFLGNAMHLGVYRSRIGFYWILRFDAALRQHWLENVGSAYDVEQRFGPKG
jgi:hypothetical protein